MTPKAKTRVSSSDDLTTHRRVLDYLDKQGLTWSEQNDRSMSLSADRLSSEHVRALKELGADVEQIKRNKGGPNQPPSRIY